MYERQYGTEHLWAEAAEDVIDETYRDVVDVVEGAGPNLDCIMLPKAQYPAQVAALDILLTQIEKTMGFEVGRIGIEVQIENAQGLIAVDAIAKASPRVET